MNEITINIIIAERTYKLRIQAEEEERVRKAAAQINDRLKAYADAYAYKDHQDLLAMTALQLATSEAVLMDELAFTNNRLDEKLYQLDALLTDHLTL
ncbi:MAG TPA: cell division protein ZapA [Bacteroidales bacterium]|jgi:cell division protein ZapA|nr:cell division protein ZapA [Bacteroidales bacterium]MDD4086978.1 cell division protein ZapA [Bacteroidales bacterium]MDY0086231.1 cell division protein ZapA [Bacteroidales bacterium]HPE43942.1 cell division protein ZapA [Bacteroidales bacterium]